MTDCLVTKGRADFTVLVVTTTFVSVYSDLLSLWLQCLRKKKKCKHRPKAENLFSYFYNSVGSEYGSCKFLQHFLIYFHSAKKPQCGSCYIR